MSSIIFTGLPMNSLQPPLSAAAFICETMLMATMGICCRLSRSFIKETNRSPSMSVRSSSSKIRSGSAFWSESVCPSYSRVLPHWQRIDGAARRLQLDFRSQLHRGTVISKHCRRISEVPGHPLRFCSCFWGQLCPCCGIRSRLVAARGRKNAALICSISSNRSYLIDALCTAHLPHCRVAEGFLP